MSRKYLTERFPFLLPIRKKQRAFCFYAKMRMDSRTYAKKMQDELYSNIVFESACDLYNPNTGFDMKYQENKVFNLKLASKKINHLLIEPNETFSLFQCIKDADKKTPYKDGLVVEHGVLKAAYAGGLCQLSNSLFWVFLHSPLTIVERHGHSKKDFKEADSDALLGTDSTIAEGWLDLKIQNNTTDTYQIEIEFTDTQIIMRLRCNQKLPYHYTISNGPCQYFDEDGKIIEEVDVIQNVLNDKDEQIASRILYRNVCEIAYELDEATPIIRRKHA